MLRKYARLIAIFVLLATGGGAAVVATSQDPAPDSAQPAPSTVPNPYKKGRTGASDLRSDLRAETGVSAADRAANNRAAVRLAPQARASGIAPPCRTDFSGGVWSSRNGATPTMFVLHYTVSANRPGWSDVEAIQNYFKTSRVGSSHFIVDFEGHCLKMVPGDQKAWTQGNANPWAYSVEIVATGSESAAQWKASPLIKDRILARLVRSVMDAHGLPLHRVDPVGCVFPAGLTDHYALECGNFHTDVRKHFPFRVFMRQLRSVR